MAQRLPFSLLSDDDVYLFNEGSHFRLYDKFGTHGASQGEKSGTYFAVWAPNTERVSVIGDFNEWRKHGHQLMPRGQSGIREGFFHGVAKGALYKYHIESRVRPYSLTMTLPPLAVVFFVNNT